MKITDYAPRACPFDSYLIGQNLIGIEIGVDVGAHADALLSYNPNIEMLTLIDIWDKEFYEGYCTGRLMSKGFGKRIAMIKSTSIEAARNPIFNSGRLDIFDFIYFDQIPEYEVVKEDMRLWWGRLKSKGVLGHRNYSRSGVAKAMDEFVITFETEIKEVVKDIYANEIIIIKK